MRNKVAVCIHVYYQDMWAYISEYIKNFPDGVDYFITCREEIFRNILEISTQDLGNSVEVIAMPNLGMDVLPFLSLCNQKELYNYDAVLKLHTKNQKSELRSNQGKLMLDGLCGSANLVQTIIDLFLNNPNVGMVASAFQLRSANALMYGNRGHVRNLLDRLEIDLSDWPFFTGTMFWISGPLLRDISAIAPELMEKAKSDIETRTGGDGSIAHAIERLFGALSVAMAKSFFLTEPRDPFSGEYLLVPMRMHGPANSPLFLECGSSDMVARYIQGRDWYNSIKESALFDLQYYRSTSSEYDIPRMDEILHFIIYGDILGLNPSLEFDVVHYQLRRPDVKRSGMCSLAHYINFGSREGMMAKPTDDDWFHTGERLGLFDSEWYSQTYPDVLYSGLKPEEHYRYVGNYIKRAASPKFRPEKIPALHQNKDENEASIVSFLKKYYMSERHMYDVLKRAGQNGDLSLARTFSKRIENNYGPSRALNEAKATYYTLEREWKCAREYWLAFYEDLTRHEDTSRHGKSLVCFDQPSNPLPGFNIICVANSSPQCMPEAVQDRTVDQERVCVYTTLFGNIDTLNPVLNPAKGVDYICFTDQKRDARGWQQIIVDPGLPTDNLNAKIFKILPNKYLQDYEYSMFIDANTVLLGRTAELISTCKRGGNFVMWQHPLREDVYTEVCAIIAHHRHSPLKVLEQLEHYSNKGMPRNSGVFEASFIWRRHGDPEITRFMEDWWEQICRFSSRDQVSLGYLVWKTGCRPTILPKELGTSRENIYFFKAKHNHEIVSVPPVQNPLLAFPSVRNKSRGIAFLYHEKYSDTGSTILRGQQLSDIISRHYDGKRRVRYISDASEVNNEILILTKSFLKMTTIEELHRLRQKNIVVADFVDDPVRKEITSEIDVLLASSLCGYKSYRTSFPEIPSFHVTHHVDTRIARCDEASIDFFRAGYFGELVNTIKTKEIESLVSFNLVDTSRQASNWIDTLKGFNFHYALRQTRAIDGAKPFLKGFIAAHCGSNMMIQRSAGDASYYLGYDYPYLIADDATPEQIVDKLKWASRTIGGKEWRYGREIMRDIQARSSLEYMLGEFENLLKAL